MKTIKPFFRDYTFTTLRKIYKKDNNDVTVYLRSKTISPYAVISTMYCDIKTKYFYVNIK